MKKTKVVSVLGLPIGGSNPVLIQSMLNTKTANIEDCKRQIERLSNAGCDIIRLAFTCQEELNALKELIAFSPRPLVADIQYNYKLAIAAAEAGIAKIRFNPGNIGDNSKVVELVASCKQNGIPIRIGVNSGSIEKQFLDKYGKTAKALAESALYHVNILENCGFFDIIISAKSSNPKQTVEANRILSSLVSYPLHIGVTESGSLKSGVIKSAAALGSLLLDGIGDTIRISLTDDPVSEAYAARELLKATGRWGAYAEVISCPTCARCSLDLKSIVERVEEYVANVQTPLKIAVMGCAVNGIGEADGADIALCGAKDNALLFVDGKQVCAVSKDEATKALLELIDSTLKNKIQTTNLK